MQIINIYLKSFYSYSNHLFFAHISAIKNFLDNISFRAELISKQKGTFNYHDHKSKNISDQFYEF